MLVKVGADTSPHQIISNPVISIFNFLWWKVEQAGRWTNGLIPDRGWGVLTNKSKSDDSHLILTIVSSIAHTKAGNIILAYLYSLGSSFSRCFPLTIARGPGVSGHGDVLVLHLGWFEKEGQELLLERQWETLWLYILQSYPIQPLYLISLVNPTSKLFKIRADLLWKSAMDPRHPLLSSMESALQFIKNDCS